MKSKMLISMIIVNVVAATLLAVAAMTILPGSRAEACAINEGLQQKFDTVYVGPYETMPAREMLADLKGTYSRYTIQTGYTRRAKSLLFTAIAFLGLNAVVGVMVAANRKRLGEPETIS